MRKILYITGTRADYGLMEHVLAGIEDDPALDLTVVATGMHFMASRGRTFDSIRRSGAISSLHGLEIVPENDSPEAMARFVGRVVKGLSYLVPHINPDIILLLGDRGEMLAGAIVGAYMEIPIAHVHGGDSSATVDNNVRHAISKLASIHMPATRTSAHRLLQMGVPPSTVHVVGAPGLESIHTYVQDHPPDAAPEIFRRYGFDPQEPLVLVLQHPVSSEVDHSGLQMVTTMEAVKELGLQTIVIYPNSDAGSEAMIHAIEEYRDTPNIRICKHIPRDEFLALMSCSSVLVGNSSSGIIEAASFGLPVVNIGNRQAGRERGANVIDVQHYPLAIKNAINRAIYDQDFLSTARASRNPYAYEGDATTTSRIVEVLRSCPLEVVLQ